MNVWIENPFDNLPGEGGRAGRYEMMARSFAAAGHTVVVWTSDFSHTRKAHRTAEGLSLPPGVDYRLIPTRPYDRNVSFARIASHRAYAREWHRRAADARPRPDLLIVSAPPLATGDAAIAMKAAFGCKLIVDVQDAWPETFYRLLPRCFAFLGPYLLSGARAAVRRLYRAADLVTGVTEGYRTLVGRDTFETFRLGIDLPTRPPFSKTTGGRALVYAGNLGRSYDLKTVLEALTLLPEATLDVAGFGEGGAALGARARALGLGARVRFHGYLGPHALHDLLTQCDVGIVPMPDDAYVGVPNKVADYAAAGLGIVSSLHGECGALLTRYRAGTTYSRGDARGLAAALRALPPEAGRNARAMAEAEFDARKIYSAYVRRAIMI